jgi:hypothetical protein
MKYAFHASGDNSGTIENTNEYSMTAFRFDLSASLFLKRYAGKMEAKMTEP